MEYIDVQSLTDTIPQGRVQVWVPVLGGNLNYVSRKTPFGIQSQKSVKEKVTYVFICS